MSPDRSPHPDQSNLVGDAFLSVPPPDGALPDMEVGRTLTEYPGHRNRSLTDAATTCPDGLLEEVLWGLLHGLTAPVTRCVPGTSPAAEVHRD
ncbi:hypothetical protein [uncultured Corynebacterium sp.]|uniref:hypothetical protein n=1 Tax=uncultured Corynebacterium sp. TaxID=159447 RepID=UPI0025DEB1E5|nr:hypothetical protein [uncultured Corynebacterium sp.]